MSVARGILSVRILHGLRRLSTSSNILESGFPDVTIPDISLPELLFNQCEQYAKFTAIECGITGRKYTYAEVLQKSKYFSRNLRKKLGFQQGDVVALLLPNIPEFPIAALGALHSNLIVTTINPIYTKDEIYRQLLDASAKAIITTPALQHVAVSSCQLLKRNLPVITIRTEQGQTLAGAIDFSEFCTAVDYPDSTPSKPEDVAFLPYSSGTTGLPKGVQLTHRNLVANLSQNNSPDFHIIEDTTDSHQDVIPAILPMFHIYGLSANTLLALIKGTKIVTLPKFTADDYVNVLRGHKPHVLLLVPPIVLFLAGNSMVKREDLDSVRVSLSGAAPLGALDEQRLIDKAGKHIHMLQGYGLTETSPTVTTLSIEVKNEFNSCGSIGRPVPNTFVKVVDIDDPTGTPLGPNTQGELLVKGPQVMKGYLNKPEETEKTFLDGWLRTGDMAYYDDDRLLYITDRLKELIKVKGFQVAPAELEAVIRDFPSVADAAVIGVPHTSQGEAPRAYVVAKKGLNVNIKDLNEYFNKKVAPYKQLKGGVEVVETIPKNASGKIMRRKLKLEFDEMLLKK